MLLSDTTWIDLLSERVPLWVVFALLVVLAIKYVPTLVTKHLATMDASIGTQSQTAQTMRKIGDQVRQSGRFDLAQHRAAIHLAKAINSLAPDEQREKVEHHTSKMLDELQQPLREETPDR